MARTAAIFTPELMARHAHGGDPSQVPIFIVGLPRSGSTLIEQILASHPQVFGAGEIPDFDAAAAILGGPEAPAGRRPAPFPDILRETTEAQLRHLGRHYLARLRTRAPDARRIVDKNLRNFLFAGLIHLALPNARIIHVRRDPVDTCLSCFARKFAGDLSFVYDLGELGRYYRAYAGLMAHWRALLPPDILLEVHYEQLVADFAPEVRRLLAHCGLDFNDRCLRFHETRRPVKTASAVQVREPLYRSAVGSSRPYRAMLAPLIAALGEDLSGTD